MRMQEHERRASEVAPERQTADNTTGGAPTTSPHVAKARDARLRKLGIVPEPDIPPFDIIGDIHGCVVELRALLERLGYQPAGEGYTHPDGRRVVFVGDLVDRGPGSIPTLRIVLAMREAGTALLVMGNHDYRFLRWLRNEPVRIAYGLRRTIGELSALPAAERRALRERLEAMWTFTPGYLLLDDRRLVVTHGAILDSMLGEWDANIAHMCLYGDVAGVTPNGRPIRRNWGALRNLVAVGGESAPLIVYGHNVAPRLEWVRRTLDLDTGCVYGGALSALRYPEGELIQENAHATYARRDEHHGHETPS